MIEHCHLDNKISVSHENAAPTGARTALGQKNKSKKVESNLNPEFEFTTGYVTEEGGPNELVIGIRLTILYSCL